MSAATALCVAGFPAVADAATERSVSGDGYVNYSLAQDSGKEIVPGTEFLASVNQVVENESILSLTHAKFEIRDGDIVVVTDCGTLIENISATIEAVPGTELELLSATQLRTTLDPDLYPELQLKCGVSALAGGTAGLVATGLGLAAIGATTGGAALAVLALGGAAGYGTGAVAGGCFD